MYPFDKSWDPRLVLITLADKTQHVGRVIYGDSEIIKIIPYDHIKKDFSKFILSYPARAVYQVMEGLPDATEDSFLRDLLEMQDDSRRRAELTAHANKQPVIARGN